MDKKYEEIIGKYNESYIKLTKEFKWQNPDISKMLTLMAINKNIELDSDRVKKVMDYFKKNAKTFSSLKGTFCYFLSGQLVMNDFDSQEKLESIIQLEKTMKKYGFKDGMYLPITIFTLIQSSQPSEYENTLIKAKSVYSEMKKNHPYLTSGDDYSMAILIANSDIRIDKSEEYYNELVTNKWPKANGTQALSHILSLNNQSVSSSEYKCKSIYEKFKSKKYKISNDYLSLIGTIGMLEENEDEIIDEIVELAKYLKKQKHFKWSERNYLMMVASQIVINEYIGDQELQNSVSSIIIENIVISQQIAMMAGIMLATTAAVN